MIILMLLGCTASETEESPGEIDSADTALDTGPVLLTPDEVFEQLDAFFSVGIPDPNAIEASYLEALTHGDETCPGMELQMNTEPQGCVAESGYWFSGLSTYLLVDEEKKGQAITGWTLSGEFEIIDPTGDLFSAGGAAAVTYGTIKEGWTASAYASGSWLMDGEVPFLDAGYSGMVSLLAEVTDEHRTVVINGSIAYGGSLVADFDSMYSKSWECPDHMIGLLQVRDEFGRWYQIDMSTCGGCGVVSFDGTELGEGCLETEALPEMLVEILEPVE